MFVRMTSCFPMVKYKSDGYGKGRHAVTVLSYMYCGKWSNFMEIEVTSADQDPCLCNIFSFVFSVVGCGWFEGCCRVCVQKDDLPLYA